METVQLRWWGGGAFEALLGDVNIMFDPYLFGEYLERAEPIYDYIFISHEHFDHCHPKTLRRLCRGERFQKLFVSPGCVTPNLPIALNYGDAAFERDLPITRHIPADRVQVLFPKYRDDRQCGRRWEGSGGQRQFPGPVEVDLGPLHVETIESGENQRPDLPTVGYLVTHTAQALSLLHIGDLWSPYPELGHLRGRVDILIHMKVGLTEWGSRDRWAELVQLVELVQPRFLVPVHYRTDRLGEPVPVGHWPPNVSDVAAFIESIRAAVGERTTVWPFTAGIAYEVELPARRVRWPWRWVKTWTVPPWREGE